jgi:putative membrane protein
VYTILHLAVLALTVFILSRLLPDIRVRSAMTAVIVAVVFSVLNFFLGWLIRGLLFVPAILTLGLLFLFIPFLVNVALLWLTDKLIASFEIRSLRGLLVIAAAITLVNAIFHGALFQSIWLEPTVEGHPRWV